MLSHTIIGSRENPALVFLHGFLGNKQDWKEVAKDLKQDFCCYLLDLPGHGGCQLEFLSLNLYSWVVEKILDTLIFLKIEKCVLIGYSMGGRLALHFTKRFPHRIKKLIIVSSHYGLQDIEQKRLRYIKDLEWAEKLKTLKISDFLNEWYGQPVFDSIRAKKDIFESLLKRRQKQRVRALSQILKGLSLAKQDSFLSNFPNFPPTLFLCGKKDIKYQKLYSKLLYYGDHIQVEEIEEVGHAPHLENKKLFTEVLQKHLKRELINV